MRTRDRILTAALTSFGTEGFDATSLDDLASVVGVRKQTILYYFPTKDALLAGAAAAAAAEVTASVDAAVAGAEAGWAQVEAVVRSVLRLSGRRPEVVGLLREVTRVGGPDLIGEAMRPLLERASGFLDAQMLAGHMRPCDPRDTLTGAYALVVGMATEVEVLRLAGVEPGLALLRRHRRVLLDYLGSTLLPAGQTGTP